MYIMSAEASRSCKHGYFENGFLMDKSSCQMEPTLPLIYLDVSAIFCKLYFGPNAPVSEMRCIWETGAFGIIGVCTGADKMSKLNLCQLF